MYNIRENLACPIQAVLALLLSLSLAACGFQLRGMSELSFKTLYIQDNNLSISQEFRQTLKNNGINLTENTAGADLMLELMNEVADKRIQSLSGNGAVREYELTYSVVFRTRTPDSPIWSEPQTVQTRRNFSYIDSQLLGEAEEEARLNRDMRSDVIREIMRRVSAVKLSTTSK